MHQGATTQSTELSHGQGPARENVRGELLEVLQRFELPIAHRALVRAAVARTRSKGEDRQELGQKIEEIVRILLPPRLRADVLVALHEAGFGPQQPANEPEETLVPVGAGVDPSASRAVARELCRRAGLSRIAMQRVLNAVGELSRNISAHAGEGHISMRVYAERQRVEIVAEDQGPGIADVEAVLSGRYRGRHGRARGLQSVQRLASSFQLETGPAGTRIELAFEGR